MIPVIIGVGVMFAAFGAYIYDCAKAAAKEEEHLDYLEKQNRIKPVELVSSNYQGRKKYKEELGFIETDNYRSISRAKDELRELARKCGGNMVINVNVDTDTDWEPGPKGGRHYYSVWSVSGIAVTK